MMSASWRIHLSGILGEAGFEATKLKLESEVDTLSLTENQ
tara:strand:+ start:3112 stop:3231 length:120 start_codon:yes stop_codon:yes gene_type:complete